ncbi:MAG: C4-dicarboxylate TRAP transporter substrate-binding protein [Reyranellaceae bacterium]
MNLRRVAYGLAFATAIAAAIAPAQARELKASTHLPPKNDTVANGWVPFAKYVEDRTKGEITIKTFNGGALLGPRAAAEGIRDGVVDLGYVIVGYHTAEFPHLGGFANDLSAIGVDPVPVVAATSEWVFLNCKPCLEDFKKQGNVFTGAGAVPGMVIMSKVKLDSLADYNGRKIRSNGGFWDEFIKTLGAVPVNVPSSEQYEALNRGLVEAVIHVPSSMKTYGLWDMVKDVTLINFGVYRSINTFTFNPATWKSLTTPQRKAVLESAMDANLDIAYGYGKTGEQALEESAKKGISIHPPGPAVKEKVDAFIKDVKVKGIELGKTKYNIADADKMVESIESLNTKWQKIWEETGKDLAKFKVRVREEIVSKVDPATYFVQ